MKIKSIKTYCKNLSLIKPYSIAHHTFSTVENVFLEIELANGMLGIGAANPAPEVVMETPAQTYQCLQSDFIQNLAGRDIRHFQQLIYEVKCQFPGLPGTQAAVDIALHDAFGNFLGIPVVQFYGQKIKSLPTSVTIGIMNVAETLQEAEAFYQKGFRVLKVKTGMDIEEDIERVLKLQERFKNNIKIRVDANQGYTLEVLNKFIEATTMAEVELIEQPLPVANEKELLNVDRAIRKYLAADESLKNAGSALALSQPPQPFGIFNIKLMKCGGILSALEIATIARNAAIELFWGCNDESIISITAALHVAFACENTRYIDLDGSFDLAEDIVTGGFVVEDGYMKPNGEAGLGVSKLKKFQPA